MGKLFVREKPCQFSSFQALAVGPHHEETTENEQCPAGFGNEIDTGDCMECGIGIAVAIADADRIKHPMAFRCGVVGVVGEDAEFLQTAADVPIGDGQVGGDVEDAAKIVRIHPEGEGIVAIADNKTSDQQVGLVGGIAVGGVQQSRGAIFELQFVVVQACCEIGTQVVIDIGAMVIVVEKNAREIPLVIVLEEDGEPDGAGQWRGNGAVDSTEIDSEIAIGTTGAGLGDGITASAIGEVGCTGDINAGGVPPEAAPGSRPAIGCSTYVADDTRAVGKILDDSHCRQRDLAEPYCQEKECVQADDFNEEVHL